MKTEVLRMLKEAEGYISGQEICEEVQCFQNSRLEGDQAARDRRISDRSRQK